MPSFGEKLKLEREKRSITLEQISVATKIGTRMLEALEQEKFNRLPGGIFNKGFVRAYARCLGLDEDQAVADYLEASGEASVPRLEPEAYGSPAEPVAARRSPELPWGLLAAILLVIAVGLSIWSYRKREHRAPPVAPHSVAAPQKSVPPASAAPSLTSHPADGSGKPLAAASPNLAPDASTGSTRKVPASSPAPPEAAAAMAQLPGEFVVLIQAREDSWLLIIADGEALPSEVLSAGSQRAVHGRKHVVVKAGNTGGLDFFFNRKKLPPQGEPDQVRTLTFGPQGLEPSALAPPITQ
ncbi:MAG: RodZ domain-containing protein [Terriglobales bacterium]